MPELIQPGDALYDPRTGTRITLVELRADGFVIEQRVEPNKVKSTLNHIHQSWTETFEIVSGRGSYQLAGVEVNADPGDVFSLQAGQPHIHPWNTGTEELFFRQRATFAPADPTAAVDTFLAFSTMFGLATEGKANQEGVPKNPLQLLVILESFRQHGGYLAGIPTPLQDLLMAGGAALGRAFGYRPWYDRYLPSRAVSSPFPEASRKVY